MKKLLFRLHCAFAAAKAAYRYPDAMVSVHFTIIGKMYENILKVSAEHKPIMFQIGIIVPEEENHCIATVWVGAGADSSPVKRIEQLYNENIELKRQLGEAIKNKG